MSSDKFYWHGYIDFYEKFFVKHNITTVAEFGIYRGDSIRWLLSRFPYAKVYGADIIALQATWPKDERFRFFQLDQGNLDQIKSFLGQDQFDLIIDDGSHLPLHQLNCLIEGIRALNHNGIYIVEDVHTSKASSHPSNVFHVLLAIDHHKRVNKTITENIAFNIARNSLVSAETVLFLNENISGIHLYKRSHLPDRCYNCGSEDFDYCNLRCICGVDIMSDDDSMSFLIEKL